MVPAPELPIRGQCSKGQGTRVQKNIPSQVPQGPRNGGAIRSGLFAVFNCTWPAPRSSKKNNCVYKGEESFVLTDPMPK